ncbi:Suppressor of Sensor Kinase (SLN1) [Phlyctochytrium planicorne]|nr:Suppressor of Sensor Kinase (SLN1) [Phlyctochytrium planicorne]
MSLGSRFSIPSPPEKGSFPLDLGGECKEFIKPYISCIKANKGNSTPCRTFSKIYLECRMNKGLMTKEDLANLGFADLKEKEHS